MMDPKVSVIVPTYNRGRLLGRALESVLAQTEQNFEVLIIDDGSRNDEQARRIARYGDPRLHYSRLPEQRGPAAARNAGLRLGRGSYIGFLDDDDEWLPEKLARQLEVLEDAPAQVGGVCTARFTVDSAARTSVETRWAPEQFERPFYQNLITTSSLLVRRECFDAVGEFDEQLEASEDWDMWLRISQVYRFTYVDEPLVRYFVHGDQLSVDHVKTARAFARILEKHAAFYRSDPKSFSRSYVGLGILWCYGDLPQAWKAFWRALRLDPASSLKEVLRKSLDVRPRHLKRAVLCLRPKSGQRTADVRARY